MIRRLLTVALLAVTLAGTALAQSVMVPGPGLSNVRGFPTLVLDSNGKGAEAQPDVGSPYSYSFSPANPPSKVFVAVQYYSPSGVITGVTYGGQAMTSMGSAVTIETGQTGLRLYYILAPSTTGTATVQVSVDSFFVGMGVSVVSFTGGDPSSAIRGSSTTNSSSATSMTVTQTGVDASDIVLAFGGIASPGNAPTYTSGTRVGADLAIYTQSLRTVAQNTGTGSVAITGTISFDDFGIWAMAVKGN